MYHSSDTVEVVGGGPLVSSSTNAYAGLPLSVTTTSSSLLTLAQVTLSLSLSIFREDGRWTAFVDSRL